MDVEEIRARVFECADCERLFFGQPMWFCYVCNQIICLECERRLEGTLHCFDFTLRGHIEDFLQIQDCDRAD